jgi:hypothetical protein
MWSWREELNLQPSVYKTDALPLSYASAAMRVHRGSVFWQAFAMGTARLASGMLDA